ncbi:hypothetical protein [Pseudomonas sp. UBA6323]|uniref:hypothetical protein n=1 Tax=Pseudomonas sp. UBA6323 TaxID=1947329 RepID=UPI0025FB5572|nr:hypothetical protein [Pseudomonas sp. UBA6323]
MNWLSVVPTWAWCALALAVEAGGQQIRINSLQGDLSAERDARIDDAGKLGACRNTRTNLLGQVIEQNGALAALRAAELERGTHAREVQQQAEGEAQLADRQALAVMQERTPAGADACAAASAAFDDELKRERGL